MEPFDTDGSSPEPGVFPYASAAAFRTALQDRFAVIAKSETRYSLDELQRQFAYDRALARLFTAPDAASWVLKGAGALLARLERARHSKDIDVYFAERSAAVSDATSALRRNLSRDLGDFFGFEVTRIVPLQEEAKGSRVHVRALLGAKTFARCISTVSFDRHIALFRYPITWPTSSPPLSARTSGAWADANLR